MRAEDAATKTHMKTECKQCAFDKTITMHLRQQI